MKNYLQEGKRITWTNNTGIDVAAGAPVIVGALLCVACVDIANGKSGALATEGVYELPKAAAGSGKALAQGEALVFDATAGKFEPGTTVPDDNDLSGGCIAWEAALTAATTVKVKINVGANTVGSGS